MFLKNKKKKKFMIGYSVKVRNICVYLLNHQSQTFDITSTTSWSGRIELMVMIKPTLRSWKMFPVNPLALNTKAGPVLDIKFWAWWAWDEGYLTPMVLDIVRVSNLHVYLIYGLLPNYLKYFLFVFLLNFFFFFLRVQSE